VFLRAVQSTITEVLIKLQRRESDPLMLHPLSKNNIFFLSDFLIEVRADHRHLIELAYKLWLANISQA